jgi:hypothetical protein
LQIDYDGLDFGRTLQTITNVRARKRVSNLPSVETKGFGERGRNRTYNLLIKSQLLCQLSYAPF